MASDSKLVTGYAPSIGAPIYFESAGAGPALVFIHAGVSDRRMWDPQFEAFAQRFQVIRYDIGGFGKSKQREGPQSLRGELLSVLQFIGIKKAALVGCSMGGAAAIDFTLEHPEMVSALVTVGSGVGGWSEWSPQSIAHWGELMALVKKGEAERARELDARYWIDGPAREMARIAPLYRNRAREIHAENFDLKKFMQPEDQLKPPAIKRLRELRCPTLVVVGDADADDLKKIAHLLVAEIAGAKMATIENAAHLPSLEHPEQFNALLLDFLTRAQ